MDRDRKTLSYSWLIYLLVVLLATTILILSGKNPASQKPSMLADLSASRTGTIVELAQSKEWRSHVRFFRKTYLVPESNEWSNPPAARPVATTLRRQPTSNRFASLRIVGPEEPLKTQCKIQVRSGITSRLVGAPADAAIGPILRDNARLFIRLLRPQAFLKNESVDSQEVAVATSSLQYNQTTVVDLPIVQESRDELGQDHVHLTLELVELDPSRVPEEVHETASTSSDIPSRVVSGDLSFNDFRFASNLVFTPAGRYVTLIITGDHDLKPHIRCMRTDNGSVVGTYSDNPPMLAVAANSLASIKVHMELQDLGQALHYRIVSLGGEDVTTKALLLWFVAHDLTSKEIEGRLLSLPEIDQRSSWLKEALGVQFTDQDIAGISDPDVKQVLHHLMPGR